MEIMVDLMKAVLEYVDDFGRRFGKWNRLFFCQDERARKFLSKFRLENKSQPIPVDIDDYVFADCFDYKYIEVPIGIHTYRLFEIDEQKHRIRINEAVYAKFQKKYISILKRKT